MYLLSVCLGALSISVFIYKMIDVLCLDLYLCLRHIHVTARRRVAASERQRRESSTVVRLVLAHTAVSTVRSMSVVVGCPSFECLRLLFAPLPVLRGPQR